MEPYALLSALIFLPAIGAIALWLFIPRENDEVARYFTLLTTVVTFALSVYGFLLDKQTEFQASVGTMQNAFNANWIPSFDIYYFLGIDGISFPLVMLTTFVSMLAMGASWSITKHVKAYCVLFLLLETGMIGVFMALDFFLFYVFWEVMLLPMYFLIGVWGGPRREYAAIKFFLYTLVGSVLMLIALLMLYFNSDLREVAKKSTLYSDTAAVKWDNLNLHSSIGERYGRVSISRLNLIMTRHYSQQAGDVFVEFKTAEGSEASAVVDQTEQDGKIEQTISVFLPNGTGDAETVVDAVRANYLASQIVNFRVLRATEEGVIKASDSRFSLPRPDFDKPHHTFNLLAMAAVGQHTNCYSNTLQIWAFLLLFIGFIIKVPSVPVHTWLPDAHVEAPTPISMILAGVLLKMGGYGIIRICYPICPYGGYYLMYGVCTLGVVSMIYGAFAALAQTDFKRLVAYSSVSHMGYVVLGLGVWSVSAPTYNGDYWNMGINGAMFQMIGHGISSAGMFFMVGIVYDRVHHRNLSEFGGLFGRMPFYTAMAMGLFFAGLGLPGLCGFIGEVFVVLSVWKFDPLLAILSAFVVILTAGYILWAIQRVYLGAEYRGPHGEALVPTNYRERVIGVTLLIFAVIFGVFPHQTVLQYMEKTVDRQVEELSDWTRRLPAPVSEEESDSADKPAAPAIASPPSEKTENVVTTHPAESAVAESAKSSSPSASPAGAP